MSKVHYDRDYNHNVKISGFSYSPACGQNNGHCKSRVTPHPDKVTCTKCKHQVSLWAASDKL